MRGDSLLVFSLVPSHGLSLLQGGYTALHLAARYGTIEGLERLLEDLRIHLDAITEVRPCRMQNVPPFCRFSCCRLRCSGPHDGPRSCATELEKG